MLFDPIEMYWVHQLRDAFEEDPFAAIDELEKRKAKDGGPSSELFALRAWGERRECLWSGSAPADRRSPARSFGRTRENTHHIQSASERESVGGSDRGSRMYSRQEHERLATGEIGQWDVSEELLRQRQEADERHRAEVKGWILPLARRPSQSDAAAAGLRMRGRLYDIRAVAMQTYST